MTRYKPFALLIAASLALAPGCASTGDGPAQSDAQRSKSATLAKTSSKPTRSPKAATTTADNPTTRSGRGAPTLDDVNRPAAWVYIDGREGKFTEHDGQPAPQWVIEKPVAPSPTFRVETFSRLLGGARDFSCVLSTISSSDGSMISYAIQAVKGTFRTDRDYPLLKPGKNFTIRNRTTGDVVTETAPLAPGTYLIAVAVKNRSTKREGLAVTRFTVAKETP